MDRAARNPAAALRTPKARRELPEPLTRAAFAPFGQVIETRNSDHFPINGGMTDRFHALSTVELDPDGKAILSIFRSRRWADPIQIKMLERHPLASQAFMPLSAHDWLVVVAETPEAQALKCFRARGDQGVQYAAGVWHHPLLVDRAQQFLVIDRDGAGRNLEEAFFEQAQCIDPSAFAENAATP